VPLIYFSSKNSSPKSFLQSREPSVILCYNAGLAVSCTAGFEEVF